MASNIHKVLSKLVNKGPVKRNPYLMQIHRVAFVEKLLLEQWDEVKEDLSLRNDQFYEISDWCVVEAFQRVFSERGVRICGHYRFDEGRCVYESCMQRAEESIRSLIEYSSLQYWRDCQVKIMVLSDEAIIARQSPNVPY